MRVLILITRSERGGAQIHVLDLIRTLQQTAQPILACGDEGFLTEEARKLGIEVHVIPELVHPIRPGKDLRAALATVGVIRKVQPDVIHAHTAKAGLIGRLAGMLTRTPSCYTVHSWSFVGCNSALVRRVAIWIERAMRICGGTVIDVCHSNFVLARKMRVVTARRHVLIRNGMPDTELRAQHRQQNTVRLLMAARFVDQKDQSTLLRALAAVHGPWQLTLAGDGPTRRTVEQLSKNLGLENRVHFVGNIGHVEQLMAEADIFVLSTCYESLPLSIIEAMRAALPVIATDVGGISELVTDGVTGHLAPLKDDSALREPLVRLIESREDRIRMGQNGRIRYERHFRLSTMVGNVLSLYRDFSGRPDGTSLLLKPEVTQ
ncbi:MAG: glycosyltransferase family 4 protein [Bryobacteraceae bacterium]